MTDQVYKTDALIAQDIDAYLESHQNKSLRFITCGSVDDGKSTLIGRLLYDSKMIFEDQLAQLEADSKKVGTQGKRLILRWSMDWPQSENRASQLMLPTVSLPPKSVSSLSRTHRDMNNTRATWSRVPHSGIGRDPVDARKGVLTQTRRHSYLCHLLGIKNIVLAVNKMDLVDYDQATFDGFCGVYRICKRHRYCGYRHPNLWVQRR